MGNISSSTPVKHLCIDWQQTYLNDYEHVDEENFGVKVYTIQDTTDGFLLKTFTDLLEQGNLEYDFVEEPSPTPTNLLEDMMRYMNNPLAYYDPQTNSVKSLE